MTNTAKNFRSSFALSVAHHWMRCSSWRDMLDRKVIEREPDRYILRLQKHFFGIAFCPFCGTQVIMLKRGERGRYTDTKKRGMFYES